MRFPEDSRVRDWAVLVTLMLGYVALFLSYYPPLAGIEDEVGFINQALVWSRGAISAEGAGYTDLADFGLEKGRHVASRHPGRSLAALPFLMVGGVRAVFASGLVLHLAMTAVGGLVFSRTGRSPLWAVLLLMHPTLAIYSRTVMADGAAGACLLLAALFVTYRNAPGAIGAGLAVGLAALMRYHAGMTLPLFVAVVALDRDRPHRLRDVLSCFAAGSASGLLIVAYNLVVYGTILDPFTSKRGLFLMEFVAPHLVFYSGALMAIWPAMLPAPLLDRSPLRWLVRGVCAIYIPFVLLYYFHDRGSNWLETAILGQRLLQVALPLWVVSYAAVLDDWVIPPLRRWVGNRLLAVSVAVCCLGLLAGNGLIFRKHQQHLNRLLSSRQEVIAAIPDGSLVVYHGPLKTAFGVPVGIPSYRWRAFLFQDVVLVKPGDEWVARERKPWYLAVLSREDGHPLGRPALALIEHYRMERVPTRDPRLAVFLARPTQSPLAENRQP